MYWLILEFLYISIAFQSFQLVAVLWKYYHLTNYLSLYHVQAVAILAQTALLLLLVVCDSATKYLQVRSN